MKNKRKQTIIETAIMAALGTIIVAFCAFSPEEAKVQIEYTDTVVKSEMPAQDDPLEQVEEIEPVEELPVCWREIPLDAEVQDYIVRKSAEMDISPAIVFAIIWRESRYQANAVGDGGSALGLMQVWTRWHGERMEKLAAPNLLNPMHNVIVGMDYLAELLAEGKGVEWAITAYNAGKTGADRLAAMRIKSEYAASVMAEAERIEEVILHQQ